MDFAAARLGTGDLRGLLPLLLVVGGALLVLAVDAFLPGLRRMLSTVTVVALASGLAVVLSFLASRPADPFPGMYTADAWACLFDVLFLLAALAAALLSVRWLDEVDRGEYWALVLLATAGMMTLAHAANLVAVFLGIELLSVVLYALTGFLHARERAAEAALKYFFLGAFSSAFLLFGMALVYGATGTFDLARMGARVDELASGGGHLPMLLLAGAALMLVGFAFKVSGVPFHMWTPDVYEGAPTPIAAFMSVGTKAAAFAALLRVFTKGLGALSADWRPAVAGVAVATMLVANIVALTQRRLKRLLAFSSIAHAGYALVGLVAWDKGGREATLFYLVAYAFMNLGAFAVVAALEQGGEGLHTSDLAGLARRRPWAAAAMALFLLSLAGVPPTAGFVGKFNLLLAAVEAGWLKLAVVAVLYSAVAAYYYLRIIVVMYMQPVPEKPESLPQVPLPAAVVLAVAVAGVVLLGVLPGSVLDVVARAVAEL